MKVLIIDDDEIDRRLSVRALRAWSDSVEILESSSVAASQAVLKTGQVDALLLDYQLPDGTALDVLEKLRADPNHAVAVVVLSGRDDMETAEKCLQAGAQDFILKGEFSPRHLARALTLAHQRYLMEQEILGQREQLRELAEHDALSGLYNRRFFNMSLDTALQRSERSGERVALVMLDLDRFKEINDTHGHDAGDHLIKEVAARLTKITRKGDVLCRLGGDEFAILIHAADDQHVEAIPRRIMEIMSPPVDLARVRVNVQASVGVALNVPGVTAAEKLMRQADTAMYRAKQAGKSRVHIFSDNTAQMAKNLTKIEKELMESWAARDFELYYQPMVNAKGNEIYGAETFLRWRHKERGILEPSEFLHIAEENGLIVSFGQWTLIEACARAAAWRELVRSSKSAGRDFVVSLNIAAAQISSGVLHSHVAAALESSGLPPECLELEMNERILNRDIEKSLAILGELVALGVRISLDDFASSGSSFVGLRDLPISTVKFDISLEEQAYNRERGRRFVESLLALARTQGFVSMVKHVETEEQFMRLSALQVDRWQGRRFSKPLPAKEFEALLKQSIQ